MPRLQAGMGTRGVPKGGSLEKDLKRISDPAKRKRRQRTKVKAGLKAAFPATPKKRTKAASMSSRQRARYYERQAAKNRKMAKDVERSGTGNVKAAATHRKVAKGYLDKAAKVRARIAAGKGVM